MSARSAAFIPRDLPLLVAKPPALLLLAAKTARRA
jgi:hypothetical protein